MRECAFERRADAQSSASGVRDSRLPAVGGNKSRAGRGKKLRTKGVTVEIGVVKNVEVEGGSKGVSECSICVVRDVTVRETASVLAPAPKGNRDVR